jgi:GntR family transcriptional repressor for pyruvate dehydrogenase complex
MPAFSDSTSDALTAALSAVPAGTPVSGVAGRMLELFTGGDLEPGTRLQTKK